MQILGLERDTQVQYAITYHVVILTITTVAALLGSVEAWKADLVELKRKDRECVASKDIIKECLDRQDHHSKVLKWIKKDGAPDPRHKEIKSKTGMNQDAYRQAGLWFLNSKCFKEWIAPGTGEPAQRVFWLKGTSEQAPTLPNPEFANML